MTIHWEFIIPALAFVLFVAFQLKGGNKALDGGKKPAVILGISFYTCLTVSAIIYLIMGFLWLHNHMKLL